LNTNENVVRSGRIKLTNSPRFTNGAASRAFALEIV